MFRILVLLSGYPCARHPWGNSQNHGTPELTSFDSFYAGAGYLKKLLSSHSVDYVCTTWDGIGEELIKRTYKPIVYESYSQKKFRDETDKVLYSYEVERIKRRNQYYEEHGLTNDLVVSSIRFASQLRSRCWAAKLALDLIDKNSSPYDAILLTRYDISSRGGFLVRNPTFFREDELSFLTSHPDEPRFILPSFGQLNCGFPDMWFYMNKCGLKHYSLIFDNYISDINSEASEYFKMMTGGWPFSKKFLLHSIYDYRQYSNEILKTSNSSSLMSYPDWECSNLHSYHKYYLHLSSSLKGKSNVKFQRFFDVYSAFIICSNFPSNMIELFYEFIFHLIFSLKVFFSKMFMKN